MKRRFTRLTVRVDIEIDGPAGTVRHVATTLGAGGLFVATDVPLFAGTPIVVRLQLPGEDELMCFEARVAWSELPGDGSPGMGVEFSDASARNRFAARLESWAEAQSPAPKAATDAG